MKPFIFIFILTSITACSGIDTNKIAPGYVQAFTSIKQFIFQSDEGIDPELIESIPYASMLVRIGKGPSALMILESIKNEDYTWVSADGVYLVINNGRIIETYGLSNNLKERLAPANTWKDKLKSGLEYVSYNSYSPPTLNNLKVISTYSLKGEEEINLVFGLKKLKLIEEEMISQEIAWSRQNTYWIDEDNFIWKSNQYISPRLPNINFEVTKKPR